jgi:Ser/Thr protein kinase RdoA (MazF antagonist)
MREKVKWIEALRTARMVYYSAWLARRWDDPAFPGRFSLVWPATVLGRSNSRAQRAVIAA